MTAEQLAWCATRGQSRRLEEAITRCFDSKLDQVDATPNDVLMWRDEALMLNLASFGPADHQLLIQARIEGLRDILALSLDAFRERIGRAAVELGVEPPPDLVVEGWWEQARTLEEE